MKEKQSQKKLIKQHLLERGSITPLEALNYYGVLRLAAIIHLLKQDGERIKTEIIHLHSGKHCAQYTIQNVT